jgi:hypothetical protein
MSLQYKNASTIFSKHVKANILLLPSPQLLYEVSYDLYNVVNKPNFNDTTLYIYIL